MPRSVAAEAALVLALMSQNRLARLANLFWETAEPRRVAPLCGPVRPDHGALPLEVAAAVVLLPLGLPQYIQAPAQPPVLVPLPVQALEPALVPVAVLEAAEPLPAVQVQAQQPRAERTEKVVERQQAELPAQQAAPSQETQETQAERPAVLPAGA